MLNRFFYAAPVGSFKPNSIGLSLYAATITRKMIDAGENQLTLHFVVAAGTRSWGKFGV